MTKKGDTDRPAFTDTLRAIDDSELDVYEFRMIMHIWRVGVSWESMRTLAQKCGMSLGKAHQVQKSLIDKGMIDYQERGGKVGLAIVERSPHEQTQQVNSSVCSPDERERSPHEQNVHHMNAILNEPIKLTNEDIKIAPLIQLREHFVSQTSIQPNDRTGTYERDWLKPLEGILSHANGDTAAACLLIDEALAVARGKNERGKSYPVASPRSIATIAANLAANRQSTIAAADDDTIWQRAIQAITRKEYTDERLKAAIRAIGGTGRIQSANGYDTDQLKRQLGNEYRRIPATA